MTMRWAFGAAAVLAIVCARTNLSAQEAPKVVRPAAPPAVLPLKHAPRPTTRAITAEDLMTRLYIFADDSMLGRRGGTLGNVKGTDYIASEARRLGLQPAGDSGGYFQTIPLSTRSLDPASALSVGGQPLARPGDYLVVPPGQLPFGSSFKSEAEAPVKTIYGGLASEPVPSLKPEQYQGRIVVLGTPVIDGKPTFQFWQRRNFAMYRGAAAVAISILDIAPPALVEYVNQPVTSMSSSPVPEGLPLGLLVGNAAIQKLFGKPAAQLQPGDTGSAVVGQVTFVDQPSKYPARNVVAVLPGSDPALKGQYVALGAHNDHIGTGAPMPHDSLEAFNRVLRPGGAESQPAGAPTPEQWARINAIKDSLRALWPERTDSVFNGADDDGSGSVSVLEIAEKLASGPHPKRSVLFVWHTGEELGLLGSTWFTDHPTVPRDSIVTQLNIDMIGRGEGTGEQGVRGDVGVIGSSRLSSELGRMVAADAKSRGLTLDMHFDAPGDTHQYYCRSDHYEYARFGIPIAFFFTGTHPDYHQRTDEPEYINYPHMAKIANYIADLAGEVANLDHRPVVDGKKQADPNGPCQQ